ncbi:acetoacetate--CoA ligase [Gracilibacillus alcaliphilus]|uniref:acetoacetate--CoA ligase n=1 Tax=Gracilibacillus alcaliphilus TaxID=1401441 RepID=UPI001956ECDA|nr:acetoacetate--CoA ligase [Gracilibacillus alcaliphilus]MBM7677163.1 acetoacetyl-CoA synthetase [Gracilibacillus alcaliphilus]
MSVQLTAQNNHILWEPTERDIADSNIKRFADSVQQPLFPYERLHRWSITNVDLFWSAIWDFAEVIGEKGDTLYIPGDSMQDAVFFPEAKLNFAENLLQGPANQIAAYEADETGVTGHITYQELRVQVAKAQQGLQSLGVRKGDRVAGITNNNIEGLVALLATASLGAVWTSCSPDFGAKGIIDRIGQVQPKVLIANLTYQYKQKPFDITDKIVETVSQVDSISAIVTTIGTIEGGITWESLIDQEREEPVFEQVGFRDPLYILYTSGTTGLPKAIVHSVGGTLLQHVKEHQIHCNVKPADVLFWYTNTAWMMYPWLVSGLASQATILLYDGSPVLPDQPDHLWEIAEETGVTHFGTSPKYLESLMKENIVLKDRYSLSRLKSILSCGSPLAAEQFDWVYRTVKEDLYLASISGGTEIIGCFVMGSPIHPVKRGEISCKALGMAVDVWDSRGVAVYERKGDLVCTQPFPSMPITFYGEGGDERFHQSYFADRPGIWTHGDFAEQTLDQAFIIYGRADTVLNPGGVRIGTAEIYSVLEQIPEVQDSIVFGLPCDNDEEIVLCVVVDQLTEELAKQIRREIRLKASPRHVPRRIYQVSDIPHTNNGKKVEGAAKTEAIGKQVKNKASIRNPECLQDFTDITQRKCY